MQPDKDVCCFFAIRHINVNNAPVERILGQISGWIGINIYVTVFLIEQEKARGFLRIVLKGYEGLTGEAGSDVLEGLDENF